MPRLLTITFTTAVFWAEAAYGSLKPPPTRRLRRALLHLSYSTTISRLLDTTRSSNRTGAFRAFGSRRKCHEVAHGRLVVRVLSWTSPSFGCRAASGYRLVAGHRILCLEHSHWRSRRRACRSITW